jgi:starch synthase (maltosyl-transferring)
MVGRFSIEDASPVLACGQLPAKAVVGESVPISAVAYREGHEALGCTVAWRGPDGEPRPPVRMRPEEGDRWRAAIRPDAVGGWSFRVEAFDDPYLTWRDTLGKRIGAGRAELAGDLVNGLTSDPADGRTRDLTTDLTGDLVNDLAEGARVMDAAVEVVPERYREWVRSAAAALRDEVRPLHARICPALDLAGVLWRHPVRLLVTGTEEYPLWADRQRALFSAWYEFFPRSEGGLGPDGEPRHGTFATAARRLPAIAEMGFDVVYLPPIHPIGRANRKGRDNSLIAAPGDVGAPWAVGAAEGGHDAVHPDLGSAADFRAFVKAAAEAGLTVAIDLALQCAPDHPWVHEHPQWFTTRPDGQIAYAENPPKKYEDIYPLNFDNDPEGIRAEVLRVVLHWIGQGVRIFRVDNPHTKPVDLWHWLIWRVKQEHPDVLFLAEAFTKPSLLYGLARIGFSQSYTYFTWRDSAAEMRQYCEELLAHADYMRPNFWPSTPDILPAALQRGGPPMFRIRAVLASLLSPSWGVYSGYELCERDALQSGDGSDAPQNGAAPQNGDEHDAPCGGEEYAGSEKYQLRYRDWAAAAESGKTLAPFLAKLNAIRRANSALHWLRNLRFHDVDNPALLCWSKRDEQTGNTVLVVCSFDPKHEQWGNTTLHMAALGLREHERFTVTDQFTGASYDWGQRNVVGLDPHVQPAHVFVVTPHA